MDKYETSLNEIKYILSRLVGTEDLPPDIRFSEKALDKAAIEFKKLRKSESMWVETFYISKYIKGAPYSAGNFIKREFGFKAYYKQGPACYYSVIALKQLGEELEKRNIDLEAYIKLKENEAKIARKHFKKEWVKESFVIPPGISDILPIKPRKMPPRKELEERLEQLILEYHADGLFQYIDLEDNFAMRKTDLPKGMKIDMVQKTNEWLRKFKRVQYQIGVIEHQSKNQ
jgi:hypothetical protein